VWSKNVLEFEHLHPPLQVRFCNLKDGEMQAASIRLSAPASLAVRIARQHALHGGTHCTATRMHGNTHRTAVRIARQHASHGSLPPAACMQDTATQA